jgi:spore germination cell wall hydrolase CwlJ-like protein
MKRSAFAATVVRSSDGARSGRRTLPLLLTLAAPMLGACSTSPVETAATKAPAQREPSAVRAQAIAMAKADPREKDCLVRAMYFESNRSSESGLLSVGTVVMNRVGASRYPETICGVVGAPRQFATGVLTRQMAARDLPMAQSVAEDILNGRRSDAVGEAKHFHMAGRRYSYPNMHYVTVAGGNAFYVKGERPERRRIEEPGYQLAAISAREPLATASSAAPASFAAAPLAFAPASVAAAPASSVSSLVANAPLPPNRPFDLDLRKKTARVDVAPPKSDLRLAALVPGTPGLRGSLKLD